MSDWRLYRNMAFIIVASLIGLVLVGGIFTLLNPPTDIDHKCMNMPMAEMRVCVWQELKKKNEAK